MDIENVVVIVLLVMFSDWLSVGSIDCKVVFFVVIVSIMRNISVNLGLIFVGDVMFVFIYRSV